MSQVTQDCPKMTTSTGSQPILSKTAPTTKNPFDYSYFQTFPRDFLATSLAYSLKQPGSKTSYFTP